MQVGDGEGIRLYFMGTDGEGGGAKLSAISRASLRCSRQAAEVSSKSEGDLSNDARNGWKKRSHTSPGIVVHLFIAAR